MELRDARGALNRIRRPHAVHFLCKPVLPSFNKLQHEPRAFERLFPADVGGSTWAQGDCGSAAAGGSGVLESAHHGLKV